MNMSKLGIVLAPVGVGLVLAAMSLRGPIENATGRRTETVAAILNPMVEQFGTVGSASIFAGLGLALGLAILFIGWRR